MRAMLLKKPGPVSSRPLAETDVKAPVPGPREICLEVAACGVCHTDLHTVEGDINVPSLPVIPGHQIVGTVSQTGQEVTGFRVGDRAGVAWLNRTCGVCRYCTTGRENLCPDSRYTGFHTNGGYAELACAPADFAYRLPDGFSDVQAAPLLCAGIIGYRALKQAGLSSGGRLGLYGFGASAHVAIQLACHMNVQVYVFSRGPRHRLLAEELGAVWTGSVPERPKEKMDASIIFAPSGDLVPPAMEVLDRGGTAVLAGIHMSPIPSLEYGRHLYHERSIRSVTANTRRDGEAFIELAASIPVTTRVTPCALAEANRVLADLKEGNVDGAAVLVP